MHWMEIFHSLLIPFLGGFALTLSKLTADQKFLTFDESNDIALDMVLIGVGAIGAFYIKGGTVEATIDAGVGDAFLASLLLYIRYRRKRLGSPAVTPFQGSIQLNARDRRNPLDLESILRHILSTQREEAMESLVQRIVSTTLQAIVAGTILSGLLVLVGKLQVAFSARRDKSKQLPVSTAR